MTRWRGRTVRVLLGATLLAGGVSLGAPLQGGADSATGTSTSTVTLTSSQSPSAYGEQLVLTATVIPTSEGAAPDGSVTFTDAGVDLGTVTLNSSGQAALANSDLSAGSHSLEAEYSGSATYASANSSPLAQVLTVQGSSTSLFAAPDPTGYGDTVVAVATVLPAAGSGMPTGTVALMNGGCERRHGTTQRRRRGVCGVDPRGRQRLVDRGLCRRRQLRHLDKPRAEPGGGPGHHHHDPDRLAQPGADRGRP